MAHASEADRVELVVFGDLILNLLLQRSRLVRWQRDERLGGIHELTIELAVPVPRDPAAWRLRRDLRDVPLRQRRGIEDELVAPAHEDDGCHRRDSVEVAPK